MNIITRNYKDQEISVSINDCTPFAMFNGIQAAKILNVDFFAFLSSEETQQIQDALKKGGKKQKQIIDIESSSQIFIHPLLLMRMSFEIDVEFYLWHFNITDEAIKAAATETLIS